MTEWQLIETAPKDGTPILGLMDGKVLSCLYTIAYDLEGHHWNVVDMIVVHNGVCSLFEGKTSCVFPTHWMPFPKPPKGE